MRIRAEVKQWLKKALILIIIFFAAIIIFSIITNHETEDLTSEMSSASLPLISMQLEDTSINELHGYTTQMDARYMRDTILPVTSNNELDFTITTYSEDIEGVSYELRSLDTSQLVDSGTASLSSPSSGKIAGSLNLGNVLENDTEYQLIFTMQTDQKEVYYYTRIMPSDTSEVAACVDFAKMFHSYSLDDTKYSELASYIEPDNTGDNSTLAKVTIHSSLEQVAWANFTGSQLNTETISVKEITGQYSIVTLHYVMTESTDSGATIYYDVDEYFRLRYASDRIYLLDYERDMEQLFDGETSSISSNLLQLGIRSSDVDYLSNETGTHAIFVQNGELWGYNASDNRLCQIFSFQSNEGIDVRENYDQHDIRLISISESGDADFVVYGYMNRGDHEGQVGICIYHYNCSSNSIEEVGFLPFTQSYQTLKEALGQLLYVSSDDMFYCMMQGKVYQVDLTQGTSKVLLEDISEGYFAASDAGQYLAYCDTDDPTAITILNLADQSTQTIAAEDGEYILPLCFMNDDLIYGMARASDIQTDAAGNISYGMYQVNICDMELNTLKSYSKSNYYTTSAYVDGETIYLNQAVKKNGTFVSKGQETILNNEEDSADRIVLNTTVTDEYETQVQLSFPDELLETTTQLLTPKYLLANNPDVTISLDLDQSVFYTYARGEVIAMSAGAATAIAAANDNMGVVVDQNLNYIWKRSRSTSVSELIDSISYTDGNTSSLARCLDAMLEVANEGMSLDNYLDNGGTAADIITSSIDGAQALDVSGCELEEMLYFLSTGRCVLANTGKNSYILLTGYSSSDTVYYYDPDSNSSKSMELDDLSKKLSNAGNQFLTYRFVE
ncbi:hypothetical protein [Eubacterium oxidoreducens]|uniref:Peptidase_C39 like family protein n=1 Tax=Eubacterium oxidoreducens TaxID=1732 RepID=A0A1G6CIL3_EUBOX|nr:hypothetical protein [Eubacterium oxidoreducens]SDB32704.1 hypothetical protein SAMN02910417_02424 [Eubacterium oxidoreducens]